MVNTCWRWCPRFLCGFHLVNRPGLDPAREAARQWFDECSLQPLGSGHIHDTYLAESQAGRFVLQCVNESVFRDGDLVMRQTQRLLDHLDESYPFTIPRLRLSREGRSSERVASKLWRTWHYVEDTIVVDPLSGAGQAWAAGHAFAVLQRQLAGLTPQLGETIPGFLQLAHYLREFDEVAAKAPSDLRECVVRHRHLAELFAEHNAHIHGDCKVNNLLFDSAGSQVVAIIDFDTAMYGHWAWDFGDLVRSIFYSRGGVDCDLYRAALTGFLEGNPRPDATSLQFVAAPLYVTLMLAVRFLTDHLRGDRYFKVAQRGDNLQRSREQFGLFDEMASFDATMHTIAAEVISRSERS